MLFKKLIPIATAVVLLSSCGSDETPPAITVSVSDFAASIEENVATGTSIGLVQGSTNSGSITYSLSEIDPSGAIAINDNGLITVADADVFDFETNTAVKATVEGKNGSVTSTASVDITITDVDETVEPMFEIWSGPVMTFTKANGASEMLEANQDRITDNVHITRAVAEGQIYNIAVESTSDKLESPTGTEWALGTTANIAMLDFGTFRAQLGRPKELPGQDVVLHLLEDDIYIDVKFLSWAVGKEKGGFSYERSTPE